MLGATRCSQVLPGTHPEGWSKGGLEAFDVGRPILWKLPRVTRLAPRGLSLGTVLCGLPVWCFWWSKLAWGSQLSCVLVFWLPNQKWWRMLCHLSQALNISLSIAWWLPQHSWGSFSACTHAWCQMTHQDEGSVWGCGEGQVVLNCSPVGLIPCWDQCYSAFWPLPKMPHQYQWFRAGSGCQVWAQVASAKMGMAKMSISRLEGGQSNEMFIIPELI